MKKVLIGVTVVLIVVLGAAVAYHFLAQKPATTSPQGGTQFPSGGTAPGADETLLVPDSTGKQITTKDFIKNGETVADPYSANRYQLAGSTGFCDANGVCVTGAPTDDYNIDYDARSGYFSIVLLKEPLGKTRIVAEQFLESRLGLTENQMCDLSYSVGTINSVNGTYAGEELKFSFCPGAVPLP